MVANQRLPVVSFAISTNSQFLNLQLRGSIRIGEIKCGETTAPLMLLGHTHIVAEQRLKGHKFFVTPSRACQQNWKHFCLLKYEKSFGKRNVVCMYRLSPSVEDQLKSEILSGCEKEQNEIIGKLVRERALISNL